MGKFTFRKKGFTLVELLVYIGIISIVLILILTIMYGIIYYTAFYYDKIMLKNEMFKILHKIYYNSIYAKDIIPSSTLSSIQFNLSDNYFEKLFPSGTALYFQDPSTTEQFTSNKVKLKNFSISTSGPFMKIFIRLSNLKEDQDLYATSVIYKVMF